MEIKFKKLDPRAVAPVRATDGSAGYDLTATRITTELNECGQVVLVYHTDLAFEIPAGYRGELHTRSSVSKKSLRLCNAPGVIDSDYRGEVTAKFISTTDVVPAVYKEGERFAQLIFTAVPDTTLVESETLSETERGAGGYGSTGNGAIMQSAPVEPQSSPETESELKNSEVLQNGSGEAQNSLEQAQ